MTKIQTLKDFLKEAGLEDKVSPSLTDYLDKHPDPIPDISHTAHLVRRIHASLKTEEPILKRIKSFKQEGYAELSLAEYLVALRVAAESAHVAGAQDEKLTRAFDTAYGNYAKRAKRPEPRPRLIVADSDLGLAFSYRTPGAKAGFLVVTSYLVDHCTDTELQGMLSHELRHVTRHLAPRAFSQLITNPVFDFISRKSFQRERELDADRFAVQNIGGDAQAMESLLQKLQDRNVAIRDLMKMGITTFMQESRNPSVPSDPMERKFEDMILGRLNKPANPERKPGLLRRLTGSPYPTDAERVKNIRTTAQKMGDKDSSGRPI